MQTSPRVLLCANNWGGWQVTRYLLWECHEDIAGLILHPPGNQKFTEKIMAEFPQLPRHNWIWADEMCSPESIKHIKQWEPDILVSAFFSYIIPQEILDIPPLECVNLHPAYLPYNRGLWPNVYSIIDGTPAGATVHYMDAGIDTGDIIARVQVPITETETGGSLHQRCTSALVGLFKWCWPSIRTGTALRTPQQIHEGDGAGDYHFAGDIKGIEQIDLDKMYNAGNLIDIIRANTYPPYPGAYFLDEKGEKVYMRMQLLRESDLEGGLPEWPNGC